MGAERSPEARWLVRRVAAASHRHRTREDTDRQCRCRTTDFGELDLPHASHAGIDALTARGVPDIPDHLYRIRNNVAHGVRDVLIPSSRFAAAASALPIVKLLARIAIDP